MRELTRAIITLKDLCVFCRCRWISRYISTFMKYLKMIQIYFPFIYNHQSGGLLHPLQMRTHSLLSARDSLYSRENLVEILGTPVISCLICTGTPMKTCWKFWQSWLFKVRSPPSVAANVDAQWKWCRCLSHIWKWHIFLHGYKYHLESLWRLLQVSMKNAMYVYVDSIFENDVFFHICKYHLRGLLRLLQMPMDDFCVHCLLVGIERKPQHLYIYMYIYMNRYPYMHVYIYIYIYIHYVDNLNVHRLLVRIERQPLHLFVNICIHIKTHIWICTRINAIKIDV